MGCLHREKHKGFPATFPSNQLKQKTETTMVPEFKRFYVILPVLADIPTRSLRAYFFSCQKRTGFAGDTHFSQVIETLFTYFFFVIEVHLFSTHSCYYGSIFCRRSQVVTPGAWLRAWQLFAASPVAPDRMTCDMVPGEELHISIYFDITMKDRGCMRF